MKRLRAGQGTKSMAFSDGPSIPLALYTEGASPHGVVLAGAALASAFLRENPKRSVGGKAHDSHPLDEALKERCAEVIAARRKGCKRKRPRAGVSCGATRGGGRRSVYSPGLRNLRRLVVRYEYKDETFQGMAQLGCIIVPLGRCL